MKADRELQQEVERELGSDPAVHAERIGVTVRNGVVRLDGEVGSVDEKWAADRAVLRVAGVQSLASEIKVILDRPTSHADEDIARLVMDSLEWNHLKATGIKVEVSAGWVTLQGNAQSQQQKDEVVRTVRLLSGVKGVINYLFVLPKASE
jgi:osmotically-inducible protein OsmY